MTAHSSILQLLIEFHPACGLLMQQRPSIDIDPDLAWHRADLVLEEAMELGKAAAVGYIVAVADAVCVA